MSNCKIAGCSNAAIALGLCAKHYMRQRRTGDPTSAKLKPGPKPKPGGKVDVLSVLMRELERLRAENAELRHRGWEWVMHAWLADHPGKTRADFDRLMSCAATGKEYRAMGKWWKENVKLTPATEPQKAKRRRNNKR